MEPRVACVGRCGPSRWDRGVRSRVVSLMNVDCHLVLAESGVQEYVVHPRRIRLSLRKPRKLAH